MRARRSPRSCVWRGAADQKGFVKIGYPERVVSQTQSGTYVIGVPRGADHPQKNRAGAGGGAAKIFGVSFPDFEQMKPWPNRLGEEPVIGGIAVDIDRAGFTAGSVQDERGCIAPLFLHFFREIVDYRLAPQRGLGRKISGTPQSAPTS